MTWQSPFCDPLNPIARRAGNTGGHSEKDAADFITRRTLTALLSEATKLHTENAKDNWRAHFESAGEIEPSRRCGSLKTGS